MTRYQVKDQQYYGVYKQLQSIFSPDYFIINHYAFLKPVLCCPNGFGCKCDHQLNDYLTTRTFKNLLESVVLPWLKNSAAVQSAAQLRFTCLTECTLQKNHYNEISHPNVNLFAVNTARLLQKQLKKILNNQLKQPTKKAYKSHWVGCWNTINVIYISWEFVPVGLKRWSYVFLNWDHRGLHLSHYGG